MHAIAQAPQGREDLARGFDEAANEAAQTDPVLAQLTRLVAGMIWERTSRQG